MANHQPTLTEISRSYDEKFERGELQESPRFYRWVLRCLDPEPAASLLDVSCGAGLMLSAAARRRGIQAWGIDISTAALKLAWNEAPEVRLVRCDALALPFTSGSFDYITNLGSLEHYGDIVQGVNEMARVLRPGGRAAILLPNGYYLADIVWWVLRKGYGPSHKQLMEKFATAGEWRDLLTAGGIRVERTYAYNFCFPRSVADWQWYRRYPRKLLNLLVAPLVPFNLAYSFLFIGTKG